MSSKFRSPLWIHCGSQPSRLPAHARHPAQWKGGWLFNFTPTKTVCTWISSSLPWLARQVQVIRQCFRVSWIWFAKKTGRRGKMGPGPSWCPDPPQQNRRVHPDPLTCEQKTNARPVPVRTSSQEACSGRNSAFGFPGLSSVDQPWSRRSQLITHRLKPVLSTYMSAQEIHRPAGRLCGCSSDTCWDSLGFTYDLFLRRTIRICLFAALQVHPPHTPHAPRNPRSTYTL